MDVNDLRGLATIFVFVAFIAICLWAYSGRRKQRFDEAANLPFADDEPNDSHHARTAERARNANRAKGEQS